MSHSGSNAKSGQEATNDDEEIFESWSHTYHEMARGHYTWIISDFDIVAASSKDKDDIRSPIFSVDLRVNGKPQALKFRLRINANDSNDLWSVYFQSLNWVDLYVRFKVEMPNGISLASKNCFKTKDQTFCWGWKNAIASKKLFPDGKSPDRVLKIVCEFEVYQGYYHLTGKQSVIPESLSLDSNLKKYFNGNDPADDLPFADVVLVCGGGSYPCHKFMLSARSPVFAAMFSHPMKEAANNMVEIPDSEPYDMKNFLKFLYTDDVGNLEGFEEATLMLALADKYCVEKLKICCERFICDRVNLGNVLEAIQLAYIHNASQLLSFAMDFVTQNLQKLVHTPEFLELADNCPELLVKILMKATLPVKADKNSNEP